MNDLTVLTEEKPTNYTNIQKLLTEKRNAYGRGEDLNAPSS